MKPSTEPRRAVFLDRDGVLNEAVIQEGRPYSPSSLQQLKIRPDAASALVRLKAAGFLLIVVTNQPNVARGLQTRAAVERMNAGGAAPSDRNAPPVLRPIRPHRQRPPATPARPPLKRHGRLRRRRSPSPTTRRLWRSTPMPSSALGRASRTSSNATAWFRGNLEGAAAC